MRSASASLALTCLAAAACSATSPRPLPPRRVAFGPGPGVTPPIQPAPDLPLPTQPPQRTERYLVWTLTADALSIVPLTAWMLRPEDAYLAAPALLLAPLIHVVHGEGGKAAGSLLMRAAMLGGVYLAGRSAEHECDDAESFLCVPIGSIFLANLAIVPVMVIDSLLLARHVRDDPAWHHLPLVPGVAAGPGGQVSLTLGSQF